MIFFVKVLFYRSHLDFFLKNKRLVEIWCYQTKKHNPTAQSKRQRYDRI